VLRSINLDDEAPFMAGEVSEIGTDRGLSPEVRILNWQAAQMPPEFAFRVGHITAQSASTRDTPVESS